MSVNRYVYGTGSMGWEPEPDLTVTPDPFVQIRRSVLTGIVSDLSCPIPQVESAIELAQEALRVTR